LFVQRQLARILPCKLVTGCKRNMKLIAAIILEACPEFTTVE
jgi:hypothetical protein